MLASAVYKAPLASLLKRFAVRETTRSPRPNPVSSTWFAPPYGGSTRTRDGSGPGSGSFSPRGSTGTG